MNMPIASKTCSSCAPAAACADMYSITTVHSASSNFAEASGCSASHRSPSCWFCLLEPPTM